MHSDVIITTGLLQETGMERTVLFVHLPTHECEIQQKNSAGKKALALHLHILSVCARKYCIIYLCLENM